MIEAPHIFGSSPVARFIKLISAFASDRLAGSANALTNEATLVSVGFVLLAAIWWCREYPISWMGQSRTTEGPRVPIT
jgi:hypothetical protein